MTDSLNSSTPRRGFLTRFAAITAGLGFGGSLASCADGSSSAAAAGATTSDSSTSSDPKLDAWFAKLDGKHKQVFDAPMPNAGMVAIWPRVYINTMTATYGQNDKTTPMVILRHDALPLSMLDPLWAKYKFGEMFGIKDPKGAPATSNIYAKIEGLPISGLGIAELLATGVLVGACDVAMTVYSSAAAKKMNLKPEDVKAEWIAGILPGVMIVPSGVMAVARAQELGCTYCYAG